MNDEILLTRDCEATLIPAGNKITLQAGEPVVVTQALGGSFTVIIHGNMARIEAKDADALGREVAPAASPATTAAGGAEGGPLEEEQVLERLRTCYDPEIPVNIVDLGLIYDLQIGQLPDGAYRVEVKMTLTAPGCGMGAGPATGRGGKSAEHSGGERGGGAPGVGPALEPGDADGRGEAGAGVDVGGGANGFCLRQRNRVLKEHGCDVAIGKHDGRREARGDGSAVE